MTKPNKVLNDTMVRGIPKVEFAVLRRSRPDHVRDTRADIIRWAVRELVARINGDSAMTFNSNVYVTGKPKLIRKRSSDSSVVIPMPSRKRRKR